MNEWVLDGCTATPLASYLKSLGVLRLVSRVDSGARGLWRGRTFVLKTSLSGGELDDFFLRRYEPSPVLAPWNGGSGFYENDNKDAIQAIASSQDPRLATYQACIAVAEQQLGSSEREASPKGDAKAALLSRLRSTLPDQALEWLDAAVVVAGDGLSYPPLLGTGGNDGRLDFTNNFMQRVLDVLSTASEAALESSRRWLDASLYGTSAPGLVKKAIGQFAPSQVGGPNSTTGFTSDSLVNPWDFVLMIEGALPFAAAVARRNADEPGGVLSYPFTVRPVGAGAGSLGEGDASSARAEIWMPLWKRPARFDEVRALLAEGRVALGRKPARDALDFVRAVHRLGAYRGVQRFERYGFLMRSGKAYLATPLAGVTVGRVTEASWLDDLDHYDWLERFRNFASGDNVAVRFKQLKRRLEDAVFDLAGRTPAPGDTQALLLLLGELQAALGASRKAREAGLRPVPLLSEAWVHAADDGSAAFRVARALAGIGGRDPLLPIRAQIYPTHPTRHEWLTGGEDVTGGLRLHTDARGPLPRVLIAMLRRRLWLGERLARTDRPLESVNGVDLDDLASFLASGAQDVRIRVLFSALSLCRVPQDDDHAAGQARVPVGVALVRTCLFPESVLRELNVLSDDAHVPTDARVITQLAAGNVGNRAVHLAWRRLRASGMPLLPGPTALPGLGGLSPDRVAAALLIPLRFGAAAVLARSLLRDNVHDVA